MQRVRLPNLLIVGVTKSGTTSLYWYLAQHPEVCASTHKETNFFSPLRYGRPPIGELRDYERYFDHCSGQRYLMEASPMYFYGGSALVNAVHEALPAVRIVVTLRDPVERLWSAYRYKRLQGGIDETMEFEAFVERSIELREAGADSLEENDIYRALSIGRYIDSLEHWFNAFGDALYVMFFEHLASSPQKTVAALLDWLGVDSELASDFDYGVSQKTIEPRSKTLHHGARKFAEFVDARTGLNRNRALKGILREAYFKLNARAPSESMPADVRRWVECFYADSNKLLAEELSTRGYHDMPAWLNRALTDQRPKN